MPTENTHVRNRRKELRENLLKGVSAGVELTWRDYPDWVAQLYRERTPYERGLLAGVLLEEIGEVDDDTGGD